MDQWPALTADTACLQKLARRFVREGVSVHELRTKLVSGDVSEFESQLTCLQIDPVLARAWFIGMLHEQAMAMEQRKRHGAYYTPRGIAVYMLSRGLAELRSQSSTTLRVLDPAVGSGAFLLSALEVWHKNGELEEDSQLNIYNRLELTGLDLDTGALETAKLAIKTASAIGGFISKLEALDSLLVDPPDGTGVHDIVAGNPPYLDSERLTRQQPGVRDALRKRYKTARGNWDLSCVFVERALELVRPDGVVTMLVPNKLLAADYAAALHELLLNHELVECCDLAGLPVFKAGVQAAVLIVRRKAAPSISKQRKALMRSAALGLASDQQVTTELLRSLPRGYFCAAFNSDCALIADMLAKFPPLTDFAEIGDGCSTTEAYKLAGLLRNEMGDNGLRFVNTGLIKPYATLWGIRELVYLKQRFSYPKLDIERLEFEFPRRWKQANTPKLLLPGLASDLWAAIDINGELACGKGAVQMIPNKIASENCSTKIDLPLLAWLAWVNSAPVRWLYRSLFGGRGFGKGSLHIGPQQLKRMPVPISGLYKHAEELTKLASNLISSQILLLETSTSWEQLMEWRINADSKRIDVLVRDAYGLPSNQHHTSVSSV